jgi:hypothetical protein
MSVFGPDRYIMTQYTRLANQVNMIRDLVLYFLKQGPYDGAGDIAVLCAYLGQLQKVRAALRDLEVAVSVDDRDEEKLERTGLTGDDEKGSAQVQVAKHVGTIIGFWGPTVLMSWSISRFVSVQWTPSKDKKLLEGGHPYHNLILSSFNGGHV